MASPAHHDNFAAGCDVAATRHSEPLQSHALTAAVDSSLAELDEIVGRAAAGTASVSASTELPSRAVAVAGVSTIMSS